MVAYLVFGLVIGMITAPLYHIQPQNKVGYCLFCTFLWPAMAVAVLYYFWLKLTMSNTRKY